LAKSSFFLQQYFDQPAEQCDNFRGHAFLNASILGYKDYYLLAKGACILLADNVHTYETFGCSVKKILHEMSSFLNLR